MSYFLGLIVCPIYIVFFFGILVIFDPILRFLYTIHKPSYFRANELMNYLILLNLRVVTGATFKFNVLDNQLPTAKSKPIIIISNHQSMYDIPLIILFLRQYEPKFIAKKELGKFIPSISFLLRTMGSLLINRASGKEALEKIKSWGKDEIAKKNGCAVIFPEGTRARDGVLKPFKGGGIQALLDSMPEAEILFVKIDGSWELLKHNLLPVPFGVTTQVTVKWVKERPAIWDTELFLEFWK